MMHRSRSWLPCPIPNTERRNSRKQNVSSPINGRGTVHSLCCPPHQKWLDCTERHATYRGMRNSVLRFRFHSAQNWRCLHPCPGAFVVVVVPSEREREGVCLRLNVKRMVVPGHTIVAGSSALCSFFTTGPSEYPVVRGSGVVSDLGDRRQRQPLRSSTVLRIDAPRNRMSPEYRQARRSVPDTG